jgi:hypothetical protein
LRFAAANPETAAIIRSTLLKRLNGFNNDDVLRDRAVGAAGRQLSLTTLADVLKHLATGWPGNDRNQP